MSKVRPLGGEDLELLKLDSIESQMPVFFSNGSRFSELPGNCKGCSREIQPDLLRGRIFKVIDAVYQVEAAGVCHDCRLVTRFLFRLHDDMRVTAKTDSGWGTWRPRESLLRRAVRSLLEAFRR